MTTTAKKSRELADTTVGAIVARQPATARVFEKYRIDYCCQGQKTLRAACEEKGLDVVSLTNELAVSHQRADDSPRWEERPLSELCDHIERRHHDYLREELPRLAELIDKVIRAHGQTQPDLLLLRNHFRALRDELEPHMLKEEHVLFPAIRQLEASRTPHRFPFGSVSNPIRCMIDEHEHAGEELRHLHELTNGFQPPPGACPTWRVMLESLARLERDMHEHVHKENSILFPRAVALEGEIRASDPGHAGRVVK